MPAFYPLAEQIKDTIAVHGHGEAAKLYRKRIPFSLFHFYAFGFLPRAALVPVAVCNEQHRAIALVKIAVIKG